MLFDKQFLREMGGKTIEDKIVDQSRWSIHHDRIFEHEGKLYYTAYSVGATEMQDESPYENDPDQIECKEVHPVQKTITVYE